MPLTLARRSEQHRGTPGDETRMAELRQSYIREAKGYGSIPVPGTLKGMAATALDGLVGAGTSAINTEDVASIRGDESPPRAADRRSDRLDRRRPDRDDAQRRQRGRGSDGAG